ncbi:MAG: hypothetical protein ISS77_04460 [Phycisphaerae bacterium]|nr:hypothetical protein [Phycisphaerae bacterium]
MIRNIKFIMRTVDLFTYIVFTYLSALLFKAIWVTEDNWIEHVPFGKRTVEEIYRYSSGFYIFLTLVLTVFFLFIFYYASQLLLERFMSTKKEGNKLINRDIFFKAAILCMIISNISLTWDSDLNLILLLIFNILGMIFLIKWINCWERALMGCLLLLGEAIFICWLQFFSGIELIVIFYIILLIILLLAVLAFLVWTVRLWQFH